MDDSRMPDPRCNVRRFPRGIACAPSAFRAVVVLLACAASSAFPARAQVSLDEFEQVMVTADRATLEADRLHAADAQVAAEARARRPGIVYRNARYWARLPHFDVGRHLFEGRFGEIAQRDFERFYMQYFERYSADCGELVAARPHVTFKEYQQRVRKTDSGTVVWEGPQVLVGTFRIEREYAGDYKAFRDRRETDIAGLLEMIPGALEALGRGETPFLSYALADMGTYLALRRFNGHGCRSASAYQLRENLRRYHVDEPSLQASDAVVPGAAAETDPLPPRREFLTLEGACLAHHLNRSAEWCGCIDANARRRLPLDEYLDYAESYAAFQRARSSGDGPVRDVDRVAAACTR